MKQLFLIPLLVCSLWPCSSLAQIGVADPVTGNAAINFYGRVVDQDGQPISGAKVALRVLVGYLHSPTELATRYDKTTNQTDVNGDFTLIGASGHSVEIESIDKSGYKLSDKVSRMYPYSWSAGIFKPDTNNPVIFKMWKQQGTETLVQPPAWNGNVSCDGTTNRFNLLDGKKNVNGDLEIICLKSPINILPRENKPFDYKFEIAVLGGGVQPTEDEFTYLAFEGGYSSSFTLGQKADDPGWQGRVKKEFYIKTADGHYGRLSVDWYSSLQNPTHLDWNCSINPTGSRNLER
jgi:hypothetical protein